MAHTLPPDMFHSPRIRIFRNGDSFYSGKQLVASTRVYRNWEQFLQATSHELNLQKGAIRRIYTIDGQPVYSLADLTDGALYVAAPNEPYKTAQYPIHDVSHSGGESGERSPVNQHPHWAMVGGRNVVRLNPGAYQRQSQQQLTKTDGKEIPIFTQTSKGYRVQILVNGDSKKAAVKSVLNWRNCRSWDMLLKTITMIMPVTSAPVRKLYDLETTKRVKNLQGLHDGQILIASARDSLKMVEYHILGPPNMSGSASANMRNGGASSVSPTSTGAGNFPVTPSADKSQPPKVVSFFPNGDSYHTGWIVAVKPSRFPNLRRLLEHLEHLTHDHVLRIYATETGHRIRDVSELEHNHGYAIATADDPFISVRYNINRERTRAPSAGGFSGYSLHNPFMKVIKANHRRTAESRAGTGGASSLSSKRPSDDKKQSHDLTPSPKDEGPSQAIKAMNSALAKAVHATTQPGSMQKAAPATGIEEDSLARFADARDTKVEEVYGQDAPTRILKSNAAPINDAANAPIQARHIKIQEVTSGKNGSKTALNMGSNESLKERGTSVKQEMISGKSGSKAALNMGSNESLKGGAKLANANIKQRMAEARAKGTSSSQDELDGNVKEKEQTGV
ncbi:hypothetical protein SeMB42_g06758 [Synchytrium endobioticum]|uniref:Doublecortin domain-containing protein n=1 Tax=Synchytrium endobioticum TaxID=286115 RepID=A0A507CFF1_9FUNG|nr:hypothetical protein SeLEV6574_g07833 [Synchytrium endobioticum]TPX38407.1 hypothetical protein SeMB42_g06758 [Synchytrium endobioticum]